MSALVVGIGNPDRGDDAVGIRVVERVQALSLEGVRVATMRGDMLALFDCWVGAGTVLIVDAMQSGAEPGTVRRLDASAGELVGELGSFVSTHAFNLADAVELARITGKLPDRLVVYGIEAADFTPGQDLSEPVAGAVEAVVRAIAEECQCTRHR